MGGRSVSLRINPVVVVHIQEVALGLAVVVVLEAGAAGVAVPGAAPSPGPGPTQGEGDPAPDQAVNPDLGLDVNPVPSHRPGSQALGSLARGHEPASHVVDQQVASPGPVLTTGNPAPRVALRSSPKGTPGVAPMTNWLPRSPAASLHPL